jgi:hypothetical protein
MSASLRYAGELVSQGARVIMVTTVVAVRAAQRATSATPIVMALMNDSVGNVSWPASLTLEAIRPEWRH